MHLIRRFILAFALSAGIFPAIAQVPPPVPALPDTERRTTYSISATTCACGVGFQLYGDSTDYANWIEVFINGIRASSSDPSLGWTITSPSGSLATLPRPITDAVLTFNQAQTGTIQIVGARRPRRTSQFTENQGVSARNLNQVFTDVIAVERELWDKTNDVTGRAVLAPPGETLALLPVLASRQNMGACFDSGGNLTSCVAAGGSFSATSPIVFTGTNPTTISCPTCQTSVPNFNTFDTVAALTAASVSASVNSVTTLGYYARGDGGGATYVRVSVAPTLNCSQTSNAGGSFWDFPDRSTINVKQCGAKGDGVTDDKAAIASTIGAILATSGGTIFFPAGNYICATICIDILNRQSISFQGASTMDGNGSSAGSTITFTGTTGNLVHLDGTEAISFNYLNFSYTSTIYGGPLINLRQVSGGVNTSFVTIKNFRIGGTGAAHNAHLIDVGKTLKTYIDTGFMQNGNAGILGAQTVGAGDFSNGIFINNVWFNPTLNGPIVVGGLGWIIQNCIFEPPGTAGVAAAIYVNPIGIAGLSIINSQFDDALNLGVWINFAANFGFGAPGAVQGLSITGSYFQTPLQSIVLGATNGASITGNTFVQNGAGAFIDATGGATRIFAVGNTFVGGTGATFAGTPTNSLFDNRGTTSLFASGLLSSANANVMCYNSTTGQVTYQVSGTGCAASSLRFKQDVKQIASASAFDIVTRLDPISFTYKPDADLGSDKHAGLAAEQVASVDPDLVAFEDDGVTPHGVKYQEITPLLVGAIKKLKADNDNLAACQASWMCRLFGIR